jgi:hypothetical protein
MIRLTNHSWQVRFLVLTHDYLDEKWKGNPEAQSTAEIQKQKRLRKIKEHIYKALVFLLHVDLGLGWTRSAAVNENDEPHQYIVYDDQDRSKPYYIMMTIWYVLKTCPGALPDETSFLRLLATKVNSLARRIPRDDADMGTAHGAKGHLLRWYHHESTFQIRKLLADREIEDFPDVHRERLKQRSEAGRRAAQKFMTNKIRSDQPYTTSDEPCDRLSFLSLDTELGFETDPNNPTSCISLSKKRIYRRDWTTTVNPAVIPPETEGSHPIPRSPPWETNSLCHHAHMLIWRDVDPSEMEPYRGRCFEFLTGEVSLVESWERGSVGAILGFFQIEATCVLASTLVGIRKKRLTTSTVKSSRGSSDDKKPAPRTGTESQHETSDKFADDDYIDTPMQTSQVYDSQYSYSRPWKRPRQDSMNKEVGSDMDIWRKQLEALMSLRDAFAQANPSFRQIDWKSYRPSAPYHPDAFLNSRDDTPELYTDTRIEKIALRSHLKQYLGRKDLVPRKGAGTADSATQVSADYLHYLSVIDIVSGQDQTGYTSKTTGRLSLDNVIPGPNAEDRITKMRLINAVETGLSMGSHSKQSERSAEEATVMIYGAFLDGHFLENHFDGQLSRVDLKPDYEQLIRGRTDLRTFFTSQNEMYEARKQLHQNLVKVLDDSVSLPQINLERRCIGCDAVLFVACSC